MFRRRFSAQPKQETPELDLGDPASVDCQRRHPRLVDPQLSGRVQRRHPADLVDVSGGGLKLETEEPVRRDCRYHVDLDESAPMLTFEAEPVWNRLVRTEGDGAADVRPVYAAGFKFPEALDSEHRRALGQFVKERAERALPERQPPRYAMPEGTQAELLCESEFRVRSLSLSGMLLEADSLPEGQGALLELRLDLPEEDLHLRGRVVNRRDEPRGPARAGVEFSSMTYAQRDTLDRFLAARLSA